MSSATMASKLLDAADLLLQTGVRSTAYYAVFHAIDKLCADYVTRSARRSSPEYLRVYRALDHAPLKNAFSQVPLKDNTRLSRIGATVVTLQTERHRADYMPPVSGLFSRERAEQLVGMAREVVSEIEAIIPNQKECRILATSLLFRERKS
ncbi:hypothetical protein [Hoeflea sp.]|uniref:hypothetical protein n=1 Tax=Hoeflea sp. TaxID=1940281 RepID=UPI00374794E2